MTKEEAIMILKNEQPHCGEKLTFTESDRYEAYNMAIQALSQDPHEWSEMLVMCDNCGHAIHVKNEDYEQEPCEDAISRQAVLELAKFDGRKGLGSIIHAFDVEQLPPVTVRSENLCDHCKHFEKCERDEREFWQTGEWIESDSDDPCWYMCSECHRRVDNKENYCPNCGARMEREDEV